jgi:hypothetical protein
MLEEIEHDVFLKTSSRKSSEEDCQLNPSKLPKPNK